MRRKPLAIEAWGEGRFLPLVMMAQNIASAAPLIYQLMELVQRAECPWLLASSYADEITLTSWRRMYRDRTRCEGIILHFLASPSTPNFADATAESWSQLRGSFEAELVAELTSGILQGYTSEQKQWAERVLRVYYKRTHLPSISQQFKAVDPPDNFELWLRRPEFVFFFSVVMPCLLLHQEWPWDVFERARHGDIDAIERLLRIDPDVDSDDEIEELCFRCRRSQPEKCHLLSKAGQRPKMALDLKEIKFILGGWILQQSREMQTAVNLEPVLEALECKSPVDKSASMKKWVKVLRKRIDRHGVRCRLKAPEIKSLFDAFARDSGLGLVDPDFSGQPNSIYKRLDRKAELWNKLAKTDKIRAA